MREFVLGVRFESLVEVKIAELGRVERGVVDTCVVDTDPFEGLQEAEVLVLLGAGVAEGFFGVDPRRREEFEVHEFHSKKYFEEFFFLCVLKELVVEVDGFENTDESEFDGCEGVDENSDAPCVEFLGGLGLELFDEFSGVEVLAFVKSGEDWDPDFSFPAPLHQFEGVELAFEFQEVFSAELGFFLSL